MLRSVAGKKQREEVIEVVPDVVADVGLVSSEEERTTQKKMKGTTTHASVCLHRFHPVAAGSLFYFLLLFILLCAAFSLSLLFIFPSLSFEQVYRATPFVPIYKQILVF